MPAAPATRLDPGRTIWVVQIHSRTPEVTLARVCGLVARFGILLRNLSLSPALATSGSPRSDGPRSLHLVFEAEQDLTKLRLLRSQILNLVEVVEFSDQTERLGTPQTSDAPTAEGHDRGF